MIGVRVLHDGHVVREQVFEQLPVSIGRTAQCDLPLMDASVSRVHARVEADADGGLVLLDQGSRNGLLSAGERVERVTLTGSTRVRLGAVELEFDVLDDTPTVEFQLRQPQPEPEPAQRPGLHALLSLALGVAAAMVGVVLEPGFWSPTETNRLVPVLSMGIAVLVLLPLLATGLFVVYKVFGRRVRWADPLQTLALLMCLLPAADVLSLSAYYFVSAGAREALQAGVGVAVGVLAVVALAGVRRPPPHLVFRCAWGLGALAVILVSVWIEALSARKKGEPALDFYVQAPLFGWPGRTQSVESYAVRVRAATDEARLAADQVRKQQQDD